MSFRSTPRLVSSRDCGSLPSASRLTGPRIALFVRPFRGGSDGTMASARRDKARHRRLRPPLLARFRAPHLPGSDWKPHHGRCCRRCRNLRPQGRRLPHRPWIGLRHPRSPAGRTGRLFPQSGLYRHRARQSVRRTRGTDFQAYRPFAGWAQPLQPGVIVQADRKPRDCLRLRGTGRDGPGLRRSVTGRCARGDAARCPLADRRRVPGRIPGCRRSPRHHRHHAVPRRAAIARRCPVPLRPVRHRPRRRGRPRSFGIRGVTGDFPRSRRQRAQSVHAARRGACRAPVHRHQRARPPTAAGAHHYPPGRTRAGTRHRAVAHATLQRLLLSRHRLVARHPGSGRTLPAIVRRRPLPR